MNRDKQIYEKINQAVRLLCDVYDLLNQEVGFKNSDSNQTSLFTITQFINKYPTFTQGQIRHYIHQNINNFNEKVIRRVGKRILINDSLFFKWIEENQ